MAAVTLVRPSLDRLDAYADALRRGFSPDTVRGSVALTTSPDNLASRRVIEACGGRLVERFREPAAYGEAEALRFRIPLDAPAG